MFIHNHNSMAYVHSTIQYTLDAPAGWLQSTRTTVRAVTFKHGAGKAVTRAALTATTTTTTVAAAASSKTQQQQQQLAGSARVLKPRFARRYVLGHFVQQHNTAHAAELPISTTTTTTAAAGRDTATTLGEPERDIELHPQRVAQVVQRAKAAEALQQLSEQGTLPQPITAADKHAVSPLSERNLSLPARPLNIMHRLWPGPAAAAARICDVPSVAALTGIHGSD